MTRHTLQVIIERSDRDEPLATAPITLEGEDYAGFDGAAARARLIEDGRLILGEQWVTIDDVIVPASSVDRIRVELIAKSVS